MSARASSPCQHQHQHQHPEQRLSSPATEPVCRSKMSRQTIMLLNLTLEPRWQMAQACCGHIQRLAACTSASTRPKQSA